MQDSDHSCLHHTRVKQIKQLWDQICVRGKCFISLPSPAPDQLYVKPVTDSMQYGWRVSQTVEPWMQIKRFPKKNSEMTMWVTNLRVAIVLREVNHCMCLSNGLPASPGASAGLSKKWCWQTGLSACAPFDSEPHSPSQRWLLFSDQRTCD